MRYGFLIDHTRCIGCHACTVACKEENRVPLGTFRTWVKYVEKGAFPDTRRFFSVLRCNHCDDAPCVTICPTRSLFRRKDGIVDFDGDRCIGCKSCMQACPYDALYIDPATQTAAKCHYCAHRVEAGLEPACVVVCPVQAIVPGDLDDPGSTIARRVSTEKVSVRKPEQGTRPKVYYSGADDSCLTPSLLDQSQGHLWAQASAETLSLVHLAEEKALGRTVYDAPHVARPWGWKVSAYLWTKSIAAGVLPLAAVLGMRGVLAPAIALAFLALTTALLVWDLKRPERFLYVLFKPNPRSWLVRGAWVLIAYSALATLMLALEISGRAAPPALVAALFLFAAGTAGYSAFLFGQAEGRDFWQSPLTLPHLLAAAVVAGSATLLLVDPARAVLPWILAGGLTAHAFFVATDLFGAHSNLDARLCARSITHGEGRGRFALVASLGIAAPLALLGFVPSATPLAAVVALLGLLVYEDLWVRAGQSVPLS